MALRWGLTLAKISAHFVWVRRCGQAMALRGRRSGLMASIEAQPYAEAKDVNDLCARLSVAL